MPSIISDVLFSDPSGRRHAVVMFSGALLFSSLYVYNGLAAGSFSVSWLVFMIAGSILSGIAESFPKYRRRAAGIFRLTAILVVLYLLALLVLPGSFITAEAI